MQGKRSAAGSGPSRHIEKNTARGKGRRNRIDERKNNTFFRKVAAEAGRVDSVSSGKPDPIRMINSMVAELQISNRAAKKALEIYGRIRGSGLDQGRPKSIIAAASLFAACRITGSTIKLGEISKASGAESRLIARAYRMLINELELEVTITDPVKCISVVANRAGLKDAKTTSLAIRILKDKGVATSLAGKDPMGLAATALYMACLENGNANNMQKVLAQAASVTELTIRNRYSGIKSAIDEKSLINQS